MSSKTTSFGPLDVTEPLATIPETISEHSSGRSTTLPSPTDYLRDTRQRFRRAHEPACVVYDSERRSGSCEVSSMSIVVRALATMPVAASGYEVGPLGPMDGRCVGRRALLVTCEVTSVGKGLNEPRHTAATRLNAARLARRGKKTLPRPYAVTRRRRDAN